MMGRLPRRARVAVSIELRMPSWCCARRCAREEPKPTPTDPPPPNIQTKSPSINSLFIERLSLLVRIKRPMLYQLSYRVFRGDSPRFRGRSQYAPIAPVLASAEPSARAAAPRPPLRLHQGGPRRRFPSALPPSSGKAVGVSRH